MLDGGGHWIGLGLGDVSPEVGKIRAFMRAKFPAYAGGLADTDTFDAPLVAAVQEMQRRYGLPPTGVIGASLKQKMGYWHPTPAVPPRIVYSVCGTGVPFNVGYPWDLCEALDKKVWYHQPIGYPAAAFPMRPSYTAGVAELVRQIRLRPPSTPWAMVGYSQGAIVTSLVYDRVRNGDLKDYRSSLQAGVTFGNPRREEGHTIPGGVDPGGHGIVTPNLVDTEDLWWDMAAGKAMVGSPGNDLYATCGAGETAQAVADQEAVWNIVDNQNPISLAVAILELGASPTFSEGVGAAEAAFGALDFFVVKGIHPHTSYGVVQPIAGDPRDSWRVALDYLRRLS